MCQYTDLCRHFPLILELVKHLQDTCNALYRVIYRVQTDNCVAAAQGKTFHNRSDDTLRIVSCVVRLQTGRECSRKTDRGITMCGYTHLLCCVDQVQVAHQLADTCNDLRCNTLGCSADHLRCCGDIQQPLTELCYRPVLHGIEDLLIYIILNDSGYLILFIWNRRIISQVIQRQI